MKQLKMEGFGIEPTAEQAVMLSEIWEAYANEAIGEPIEHMAYDSQTKEVTMELKNGVYIVCSGLASVSYWVYVDVNDDGRFRWLEYADYSDALYFAQ